MTIKKDTPTTKDYARAAQRKTLLPPSYFEEEMPVSGHLAEFVDHSRRRIRDILSGDDDRLLVVVGPCSIHDVTEAEEYANRLKNEAGSLSDALFVVMRTYFEKARTTIGWKGLIKDPHLNQSFEVNHGIRLARRFLLDCAHLQIPAGTELVDPRIASYVADLISWSAIGARTSESQTHRELASSLPCPNGFKNGTTGDVQSAIDAIRVARHPHCMIGHSREGGTVIVQTSGNPDCHIVLRGGAKSENYSSNCIDAISEQLTQAGCTLGIVIDCAHGNSKRDILKQAAVCRNLITRIREGEQRIVGVMLESNLVAGSQQLVPGAQLLYGQSVTDPCLGWTETVALMRELAGAVRERRHTRLNIGSQASESMAAAARSEQPAIF